MRIIHLLLYAIIFFSCSKNINLSITKKKKNITQLELSEMERLLINKNWKEIDVTVERAITDTFYMNITKQFMHSDRDDLIIFSEDGTYIFDEGKSKARTESNQIYQQGNWHINENLSQLILYATHSETKYEIKELSNKKLILELPVKNDSVYNSYILTFTPE